jgi:hypothetical protein
MVFVIGLAAVLGLMSIRPAAAEAEWSPQTQAEACPSWLPSDRDEVTCQCDRIEGDASVWGSDVYTSDSRLCHAALHAGVVKREGGLIQAHRRPGRASYRGTTRNGLTSMNYGSYSSSIVFENPKTLAQAFGGVPLCPVHYNAAPEDWSGDCRCEAGRSGSVWGSNPYTSDSAVCSAAVHAGLIGSEGGVIHLSPAPGQSSYSGSTRNGFTSSDYGSWDSSFTVSAGASD